MTSYTFWAELVRDGEDVEVDVQYTCTPFIPATHTQPVSYTHLTLPTNREV